MQPTTAESQANETNDACVHPRIGTASELLKVLQEEGFIGMWKDREDIGDSVEFARKLRKQATRRNHDE